MVLCTPKYPPGALTAIKFYARMQLRVGERIGVIIKDHGQTTALVAFGNDHMIINKKFLRKVNENR